MSRITAPVPVRANFTFHPELCVGCGACIGACLDEQNNLPVTKPLLRTLWRAEQNSRRGPHITWYSLACLHCENPACEDACPRGCFSTDPATGTVQLDSTRCIGCRSCAGACRYRAIAFDENGRAVKCDGCRDRLLYGMLPRCVEACPRRAITIDDRPSVRGECALKVEKAASGVRLKR